LSYVDRLDAGLIACPDIVDDVEAIAEAIPCALHDLAGTNSRVS
jgi:hypothetical protein